LRSGSEVECAKNTDVCRSRSRRPRWEAVPNGGHPIAPIAPRTTFASVPGNGRFGSPNRRSMTATCAFETVEQVSNLRKAGHRGPRGRTSQLGEPRHPPGPEEPNPLNRVACHAQPLAYRTLSNPGARSNCPAAKKQTRQATAPVTANLTRGGAGTSRQASATPTSTGG
jgi:hypothetical protein